MRHVRIGLALLTGLVLLTGPLLTDAQDSTLPRIEPASCQFNDDWFDVSCYTLVVPETRADPDSISIEIHVAVFHSDNPTPLPDPVVYLDGGPGGDALRFIDFAYSLLVQPFVETRDVIIFDQRGTGYSQPQLDCPEYDNLQYDILDDNLPADENIRLSIEALDTCRRRLEQRGYNLAAYNSAENAADLNDLRVALGYDQWNLYGISYGTRLALTAMRDHPEGIRSVVIDSVVPPQVSLYDEVTANADRAFNTLFLNCTLDPVCNEHYPRLGTVFVETVQQLNANPARMYINHPLTGREYEVLVDGNRLVGLTFHALYSHRMIPLLPKVIYDARDGNYTVLASTMESYLHDQEGFSLGMHFSVQCMEEAPFTSFESALASAAAFPIPAGHFATSPNMGEVLFRVCEGWRGDTPINPVEQVPVFSAIPTLVMTGEYDPITPPYWGVLAATTLPNSYYFEIPGVGHGATVADDCPLDIMRQFLDSPGVPPNGRCITDMEPLEFVVFDTSINLVAFTDEARGVSGVRPENWLELTPGFYLRETMSNEALLAYEIVPDVDSAYLLRTVAQEFEIYVAPDAIETRAANGFMWQVYEFRTGETMLAVALAERERTTFAVILGAQRFEYDDLYARVFTPALDQFQRR